MITQNQGEANRNKEKRVLWRFRRQENGVFLCLNITLLMLGFMSMTKAFVAVFFFVCVCSPLFSANPFACVVYVVKTRLLLEPGASAISTPFQSLRACCVS